MIKRKITIEFWYSFFALSSLTLAFFKIAIHLQFFLLPIFFLFTGFLSYFYYPKKALYVLFFFLPLISSTADLFFMGYPYNYMGIPLFYLGGVIVASLVRKESLLFNFRWARWYLLFITVLWISAFFVFLRWSNLTLSPLAFFKDIPVCPSGERFSFASIFPIITLFIFSVSPFIVVFIRKNVLSEFKIFKSIMYGYSLSILLGLFQKYIDPDFMAQEWWITKLGQASAGFSDPTAFGFFSGALLFYLIITFVHYFSKEESPAPRSRWNTLFFTIAIIFSLIGIFISGSRTAFCFFFAAIIFLLVTRKIKLSYKIIVVVLLGSIFLVSGSILTKRIFNSFENLYSVIDSPDMVASFDKLSNYRISMMNYSIQIGKRYNIVGAGTGNFLFILKHLKYEESYIEDLPLNQYLLVWDETGVIGLVFFIGFLITLMKDKRNEALTLVIVLILILNLVVHSFWFPEVFLLFWIFTSFSKKNEVNSPVFSRRYMLFSCLLLILFAAGNIYYYKPLHPQNWAAEKKVDYDYGFWYKEKDLKEHTFCWTKQKSGIYLYFDESGKSRKIKLFCGAPLHKLPEKEQKVDIFWKGKFFKSVVFRENKEFEFSIEGKPYDRGFLEFRINPTFNLKKMELSEESRDLGIQVYFNY